MAKLECELQGDFSLILSQLEDEDYQWQHLGQSGRKKRFLLWLCVLRR